MPLAVPNLDDRSFQDILDEARRRIPTYTPEWTDHNLSDPGITMLELFSWMTDMLIYRLNRVPDKNYVKFLELIGVYLQPARPAVAEITFRLTAPQPTELVVGRGTIVGTISTEAQEGINFTTDHDLIIKVPRLAHVIASRAGSGMHDYMAALRGQGEGLGIFSEIPEQDDAFYIGFANDLTAHTLALTLNCKVSGVGVDPTDPPIVWETWNSVDSRWDPLRLQQDTTGGLNRDGIVIIDAPVESGPTIVDGKAAFWIRCRALDPRPGQAGYGSSPRITGITAESLGGSVKASHATKVLNEVLGVSDGSPGQQLVLRTLPVLPRVEDEYLEVQVDEDTYEQWTEVPHFGYSTAEDKHYTLDDATGTIAFGPRIRSPKGMDFQYGAVPLPGRTIRFNGYRSGGGLEGNVGANTITMLKSSVPYVAWVTNFGPAMGGTDSEDVDHAKWRGPQVLRTSERAVTSEDFERLALAATPAIGRARCLLMTNEDKSSSPGVVRLLLVPALHQTDGPIPIEQLEVPGRQRREVELYLDQRRLLTTEVILDTPKYVWVSVEARVRIRPTAERGRVGRNVVQALYAYVHPGVGGPDGKGWPFGRDLHAGEIYARLQQVEDVEIIENVQLRMVDPLTGEKGEPTLEVHIGPDELLCSWHHQVDLPTGRLQ